MASAQPESATAFRAGFDGRCRSLDDGTHWVSGRGGRAVAERGWPVAGGGVPPAGRTTIEALKLNAADQIEART